MKLHSIALAAALAGAALGALGTSGAARADDKPVKIALIADKTGPLEAYAKQTAAGFALGLEYATQGTLAVNGRKLVVIEKDSQTKPDVGRNLLGEAYNDDGADLAVGGTSSAVALAMLPVAQDNKKVLIVEPAVADSITGDKWNRYIFHSGRNSTQDAVSNALAIGKPGVVVATLAPDYAFGRDFVAAFRTALATTGAKLVSEEYAAPATTDFTAAYQRIFDALGKESGRKIIFINWAGGGNPLSALKALGPERLGISVATGSNILPALVAYKEFPGLEGAGYYYYENPKNTVNAWLVSENQKRFGAPPDFFTCGGFIAAQAVVAALQRTGGSTDTEKLIGALEGLSFDSPKGKVTFRKEDHQLLQPMYAFKIKVDPKVAWGIPELVREIPISEITVPIKNAH
jgi:branched-chain amino acid transport system substrate-binding protein